MAVRRPSRREDFEIGIICALPREYDAVSLIFDEFWDEDGDRYGKVAGDHNNYTTGRIGNYNVVLALLSRMGKTRAASAAQSMQLSYNRLRLTLVVGICGGVPHVGNSEVLLGDVVISKSIVEYDCGRQYDNAFERRDTIGDSRGMPSQEVQNLLVMLETNRGADRLRQRTAYFLQELQARADRSDGGQGKYKCPGAKEDMLFESSYIHRIPRKRKRSEYCRTSDHLRDDAPDLPCEDAGCDQMRLVPRERPKIKQQLESDNVGEAQEPAIYIGPIASADRVMKSASLRDEIAKKEGVVAFEMEAAGVWEELPSCIVVKGVCDYADSHKNKKWQDFAAATASSVAKALLERIIREDKAPGQVAHIQQGNAPSDMSVGGRCNESLLHSSQVLGLSTPDILSISSQFFRLPPQIKSPEHVTVIDARNRQIRFFLDTICSAELFIEVLKEKFKDLGLEKIKRREWYLQDHHTKRKLDLTKPWESLIRPGQLLDMTMVFRRRKIAPTKCPSCRSDNPGNPEAQVTCRICDLTYCRIEEIQGIAVCEEDQSQIIKRNVQAPFTRPRPQVSPNDDDDIVHYSRVQVVDIKFRLQIASEDENLAGLETLSVLDLDDLERIAAYLAKVYNRKLSFLVVALLADEPHHSGAEAPKAPGLFVLLAPFTMLN